MLWEGEILYRYHADSGQLDSIQFVCGNLFIFIRMANAEQCLDIKTLAPFLDARTAAQAVDSFADLIANPPSPVKEAGWERWLLPSLGGIAVVALIVIIPLFVRRRKKPTA